MSNEGYSIRGLDAVRWYIDIGQSPDVPNIAARRLHREDKPAIEYDNGDKCWYLNGKRHRLDGPAIEWASNGERMWFYHGKQIKCSSQKEFERIIRLQILWEK